MSHDQPGYGLWMLVILNSAIFLMFAFSFFKPATARDWRTFGDFAAFDGFTYLSMTDKARALIEPLLVGCQHEFHPFTYKGEPFWVLVLLTTEPGIGDDKYADVRWIDWTRCKPEDLNSQGYDNLVFRPEFIQQDLFRAPGNSDHFCTHRFRKAVEDAGLTGLWFRPVYADEPVPPPVKAPKGKRERAKPRGKKAVFMDRLWNEVINACREEDWLAGLEKEAADSKPGEDFDFLHAPARVITAMLKRGFTREEVESLVRGLSYAVAFHTLVTAGEELGGSVGGVHEELLMANPDGVD